MVTTLLDRKDPDAKREVWLLEETSESSLLAVGGTRNYSPDIEVSDAFKPYGKVTYTSGKKV